jgi:hypothetical protein
LFWLASSYDVMGRHVSDGLTNLLAGVGLLLLLAMAARTALVTLPEKWQQYREQQSAVVAPAPPAIAATSPPFSVSE